jgi:hypothetical protein
VTYASKQLSVIEKEIKDVTKSYNENEAARKAAALVGDTWTAGKFNLAAARDRERLLALMNQRAANTPAGESGGAHSSQVFFGSQW